MVVHGGEVLVNLNIMETCINLHCDKFLRQQASPRERICQRDLATTVCVEGVPKGWVIVALFLIFWVLRIQSKSAKSIKVCMPAPIRSPSHSIEESVISEVVPPSLGATTVKSHDHLMVISHQRLIMSGDVETNPGPLGQGTCRHGLLY